MASLPQLSAERLIFPLPVGVVQGNLAARIFDRIITQLETPQANEEEYNPITLVRLMKESVSDTDGFLKLFFAFIDNKLPPDLARGPFDTIDLSPVLPRFLGFASWTAEQKSGLAENLVKFAKFLADDIVIPLKASNADALQHIPIYLSRPQLLEAGTVRDHCIVTQKLDSQEARTCSKQHGRNARNDDGQPLYWSQELTIRSRA